MGELIQLRPRKGSSCPALVVIDEMLAGIKEALSLANQWLPRIRGKWRALALAEIAALEANKKRLQQERLRVEGARFAMLRGRRP